MTPNSISPIHSFSTESNQAYACVGWLSASCIFLGGGSSSCATALLRLFLRLGLAEAFSTLVSTDVSTFSCSANTADPAKSAVWSWVSVAVEVSVFIAIYGIKLALTHSYATDAALTSSCMVLFDLSDVVILGRLTAFVLPWPPLGIVECWLSSSCQRRPSGIGIRRPRAKYCPRWPYFRVCSGKLWLFISQSL